MTVYINDLVSYNSKHNELNRHNNKDGSDHNFSWNSGYEGPTSDPLIRSSALKQLEFFLHPVDLPGYAMILMGDEIRRSQHGNNNAYCQDNELSWFNWQDVERESTCCGLSASWSLSFKPAACFVKKILE
jgi:glycogen operon protein